MQLTLEDGTVWRGRAFGAKRTLARGEVVFATGCTGYVETITDPSYRGQILVLTSPLQGNYGVPLGPYESGRIQVQGLIVSRTARRYEHPDAKMSLDEWLAKSDVPALEGVDTRALTRHLRERGTMQGVLTTAEATEEAAHHVPDVDMRDVAALVSPREIVRHEGDGLRILVVDCGAKEGIVRALLRRRVAVVRAPHHLAWEKELPNVDAVVLGNGPGDPADLMPLVARVRAVLASGMPTFGICLGHQLLALAAGAKTYKLKYGHRAQNQPVLDQTSGRAYVTTQNHGYAVDDASLPHDWEQWFSNLQDGTNEGIRHAYRPFRAVQFHPEGAAGPRDTSFLFDDFLGMAGEMRTVRTHAGHRPHSSSAAT